MKTVLVAAVIDIHSVPHKIYKYMTGEYDNLDKARLDAVTTLPELKSQLTELQPNYCMDVLEDMIYVLRIKECHSVEDAINFMGEVSEETHHLISEARWSKSLPK